MGSPNPTLPLWQKLALWLTLAFALFLFLWSGYRGPSVGGNRASTLSNIDHLMTALTSYHEDFGAYPPGGIDLNDDGDLDDPGENLGAGEASGRSGLRMLTVVLTVDNNTRTTGPYFTASPRMLDRDGGLCDFWGHPLRYLADGRRTTLNARTGQLLLGRVSKPIPVIWSLGPDGKQDPRNNNRDDDGDGFVDERDELIDDLCSWN